MGMPVGMTSIPMIRRERMDRRRRALTAVQALAAIVWLCGAGTGVAMAQAESVVRVITIVDVDGSRLPDVTVHLGRPGAAPDASIARTTDDAGETSFTNVTAGEYILVAERAGFAPVRARVALEPREIRTVTLALSIAAIEEQVDVTAPIPVLPSTFSPSSTVIDAETFAVMPHGLVDELPDAIVTSAPGMIRGHDDFVHVRGQELALNVSINGVSFWENPHGLFSTGLSPQVIESVNVMTGGFPAEYGLRFGGVLDIVTKSGFSMDGGSASIGVGEAGRNNLTAEYGGSRGRMGYYLFGTAFESDRFLSPPDPVALHDRGQGDRGLAQLDFRIGGGDTLRLMVGGGATDFEIPRVPDDLALRPAANATQDTRDQTLILGWGHVLSPESLLNTTFYQRWSSSRLTPALDPLAARAAAERTLLTLGVKSDVTRFAGRHAVKAGADVVWLLPHETLSYDYSGYRTFTHLVGLPHLHFTQPVSFEKQESGHHVGAFVQDTIHTSHRVTLDLGVRFDRHRLVISRTHLSPRLNLGWRLSPSGTLLHASYDHFFVPPPVENVLLSSAGLTSVIREIGRALPPLPATVENQFELGLTQPLPSGIEVGLTGYYRLSDDPVHTSIWPDARIYAYASFDHARAYGLETKLAVPEIRNLGLSGYLNYALGRVFFYGPVTGGFIAEAEHVADTGRFLAPMDQTHTLTAGLTYRHARTGLMLATTLEYGSGTPIEHGHAAEHEHADDDEHSHEGEPAADRRVPGHFVQNLTAAVDLLRDSDRRPRLTLQVNVENLTNNVYTMAQESVFSPGQFSIPRLVSASLKVRF